MIFQVSFTYASDLRDSVHQRFLDTGGAPPPQQVDMIGRWHHVQGNSGVLLAEANDPTALAKWLQDWSDVISFDVRPVLADEEFSAVIG